MREPVEILLVEDDADFREAMRALFDLHGYRTVSAANAEEARARLRRHVPDLVVLDLGLPDPVGLDLTQEIKALAPAAPTVIAFTGHHRLEHAARAAGCDAFILKPAVDELIWALREAAEHRRAPKLMIVRRQTA